MAETITKPLEFQTLKNKNCRLQKQQIHYERKKTNYLIII
jgi:hypothetical protein